MKSGGTLNTKAGTSCVIRSRLTVMHLAGEGHLHHAKLPKSALLDDSSVAQGGHAALHAHHDSYSLKHVRVGDRLAAFRSFRDIKPGSGAVRRAQQSQRRAARPDHLVI